jgi:hypothetical protein
MDPSASLRFQRAPSPPRPTGPKVPAAALVGREGGGRDLRPWSGNRVPSKLDAEQGGPTMEARSEDTRAVIVCESMFGNTRAVADAVADALSARVDRVDVFDVSSAPLTLEGVALLVVGAPTHAFGMSRPGTRKAAHDQGADAPAERGVREWLADVARPSQPIRAAVFDTRVRKPLLPGSAAKAVRRRLRRLGFDVGRPLSCAVTGTPGPLVDGELDRARRWAAALDVPARPKVRPS